MESEHPILVEPTITGRMGRAWLLPLPDPPRLPDHGGSLAGWLVEASGYHPLWCRWFVSVSHLRDMPGVPPAEKNFAEATHEFMIVSLNPDHYADHQNLAPTKGWGLLVPADVVEQFEAPADQYATRFCELAVRAIVDGHLSPDQDYRRLWTRTVSETIRHMREGKHPIA